MPQKVNLNRQSQCKSKKNYRTHSPQNALSKNFAKFQQNEQLVIREVLRNTICGIIVRELLTLTCSTINENNVIN